MHRKTIAPLLILLLLIGCAPTKETKTIGSPEFRIIAGINHGGIVENTNMEELNNAEADAYTGATTVGYHTGVHVQLPVKRNSIESGIEFMQNKQEFAFNDESLLYKGSRTLSVSQVMIPFVYNICMIRRNFEEGLFQIRIGYIAQLNVIQANAESGNIPGYSTKNYSGGLIFGLGSTPVCFDNGNRIGFYGEIYRGSQIYSDVYNQESFEMPGSSFARAGIIYHFGNK